MANDNNGWIRCDEQLPLANRRVLVTTIYGHVVEAIRLKGNSFNRYGKEVAATHWQDLPEPAKKGIGNGK
ncbi:DUF551 domain-containing protein [Providencia sp. wls1938]|uniref:DUF551 domain-containing protein n=1 Tax=Providencia sp. wls1938 TaxID=2675151 RepID=UPI0012B672FD|nr:DUF551 domain-containing protein [Providencia sp. wls1938]